MKGIVSLVMSFALMLLGASQGWAQQKAGASSNPIVGAWVAVSNDITMPDGKKVQPFGPQPAGMLIFDSGGRYSLQLCRPGGTKFASGNRMTGTADENKAMVQACNPHWGKYSIDDKNKVIVFQIEHAAFPNWNGTQQKRSFTISGDELKYVVPSASAGGTAEVVWKRAK